MDRLTRILAALTRWGLGLCALGLVLMALDLEDVLDVRLPYDRLGEVRTVGALCSLAREMSVPWPVERPTWPAHR